MMRHREKGLALITAMLVVAIVATIAAYLSLGQQIWLRQVQNLFDRSQADSMRHAALDFIGVLLDVDAKANKTDHENDWAGLPPFPFEGGTLVAAVSDAQALFNLNNLVRGGDNFSQPDIEMFKRLLQSLQLNPALAEAVVDWIDASSQTRPGGGAEDIEYLASSKPYRAANQPLTSVDELRLVMGFDAKTVETLRPYVVALPAATMININTAKPEVIAALFPGMSPATAQLITQAREKQPFTEVADVQKLLPQGQAAPVPYAFATFHFLVKLDIIFGRWQRTSVGMINRPGSGKATRVLWHHPQYPKLPSDGEDTKTNS
jgi:general secretion pathway protein K